VTVGVGDNPWALDRRTFLTGLGRGAAGLTLGRLALGGAASFLPLGLGACTSPGRRRPNIVFILIDDLGWRDVGAYGSPFHQTPNIDRLAAEGMHFTDAYAASPVCSPTRASIMTGKYPARVGITDWIGGAQRGMLLPAPNEEQLPLTEVTLAEAFREGGYATGFVGKWHLGGEGFLPQDQGFESNVAGHEAGHPASYWWPYTSGDPERDYWDVPGLDEGVPGEYLTDRLTDEALRFLDAHHERPFLLFLSHYAVHTPVQAREEDSAPYREARERELPGETPFGTEHDRAWTRLRQDRPEYAGMVAAVDRSVGRVMDRIAELDLERDTVVVFMSDNGGLSTLAGSRSGPTCNLPLRAGKGWLYEGGIREPLVVRWPGQVRAGSRCIEPVISTDFYPTLLGLAGLDPRPDQHRDGRDLGPLLRETGPLERDALFWHFPHYHGSGNRPSAAVRSGRWKLIEWFEDGALELYDLDEDPAEQHDLSGQEPERATELHRRLQTWRLQTGARLPVPNPDWKGP
jgi:arylsulfatase A-like enzyme